MLKLDDVTVRLGGAEVVRHVSLDIGHGITALVGPNGAGKTTLFRALVGAVPFGGVIDVGDRRIGYLPQTPRPPAWFSVWDLVEYVAWLQRSPSGRARRHAVKEAIAAVGLEGSERKRVSALSGGQARRAFLAQAIIGSPDLVLLDEPTAGLDPEQRVSMRDLINGLARNTTVILSTHLTEDVERLADTVVVMRDGTVAFEGSVRELEARSPGGDLNASRLEDGLLRVLHGARAADG